MVAYAIAREDGRERPFGCFGISFDLPRTALIRPGAAKLVACEFTGIETRCDSSGCKSGRHGSPIDVVGQPCSRTRENPPYGMRGEIEKTSASLEARSAPRPTLPEAGHNNIVRCAISGTSAGGMAYSRNRF